MSRNTKKTKPNQPDWYCNQDNGDCGKPGKFGFMPTAAWDNSFPTNVSKAKVVNPPEPKVSGEVWEAKDRMNCMQTAINAAASLHEGSGKIDEAKRDALEFYDLLRQAKHGLIPRLNKTPQSSAGKKIAQAMGEPEVNVEDIPF